MVVVVTREHVSCSLDWFIAVSCEDLARFFQDVFPPEQRHRVLVLQRLLSELCAVESRELSRGLEGGFNYFARAAAGQHATDRYGSWDELDAAELKFLHQFWEAMQAGGYRHVSGQEWEAALADDFMCSLPVAVNYSSLDSRLLSRFWEARGRREREALPPKLADHCLLFYRGVGVAKMEGSYFGAKVERLIYFIVLLPLWRLVAKLRELLTLGQNVAAVSQFFDAQPLPSLADVGLEGAGSTASTVYIERRTLGRVLPDAKAVFKQLFKKVTLQEACFQDVVILYRRAVGHTEAFKGERDLEVVSEKEPAPPARNLHIKHFKTIPLADLELVLPEKAVFVPPTALLEIVVTFVLGLAAVLGSLRQGRLNLYVVGSALAALCAHAMEVRSRTQKERSLVEEQMERVLYDHIAGSQEAVLQTLLEEMRRQRARELFLAYCALLHSQQPLSAPQLDDACEQLLRQEFGALVDFERERALEALKQWGLVAEGSEGLLQAVSLETALQRLDAVWDSHFSFAPQTLQEQGPSTESSLFNSGPLSWSTGSQPGLNAAAQGQAAALRRLRTLAPKLKGGLRCHRAWVRPPQPYAVAGAGKVA